MARNNAFSYNQSQHENIDNQHINGSGSYRCGSSPSQYSPYSPYYSPQDYMGNVAPYTNTNAVRGIFEHVVPDPTDNVSNIICSPLHNRRRRRNL